MHLFVPLHGGALVAAIAGALVVGAIILVLLSFLPPRLRRPLIITITFVSGLFYALEFFLPVTSTGGKHGGENLLTPFFKPVSGMSTVLQAFALGLGIYSLVSIHLRNIVRQRVGWGFSAVLLGAIPAMAIPSLLKSYHPNGYNTGVFNVLFNGAYLRLGATMFSIIAFYIVSAAFRAFRARSIESTILLVSAFLVMLGQVAIGQAITGWLPKTGLVANLRVENVSNWILTRVNSPAALAVDFGLGIGMLATSLRLWLSLERGSYFDQEL